jgi:hypothetical protein
MKILHIVQDLTFGGVSNVIVNLIKGFHNLGVENSVITPNIGNDLAAFISHYTSHIFVRWKCKSLQLY